MLRIFRVSVLVLALSFTATAGEIQYGATDPPPSEPTATTNLTETSEMQESNTNSTAEETQALEEAQALINLLGCLLSLI